MNNTKVSRTVRKAILQGGRCSQEMVQAEKFRKLAYTCNAFEPYDEKGYDTARRLESLYASRAFGPLTEEIMQMVLDSGESYVHVTRYLWAHLQYSC